MKKSAFFTLLLFVCSLQVMSQTIPHAERVFNHTDCDMFVNVYCFQVNPCSWPPAPPVYTMSIPPHSDDALPAGFFCNCPVYSYPDPPRCEIFYEVQTIGCVTTYALPRLVASVGGTGCGSSVHFVPACAFCPGVYIYELETDGQIQIRPF